MARLFLDLKATVRRNNRSASFLSLLLFLFLLPLPLTTSRVLLIAMVSISIIETAIHYRTESMVFEKKNPILFFPIVFFILLMISYFFTEDKITGIKQLEKAYPFLLIPLAAFTWKFSKENLRWIFNAFIGGCLFASFLCLVNALLRSLSIHNGSLVFDARVTKDPRISFWGSLTWDGNYFFSKTLSVFMHPSYFSLYLLLSVLVLAFCRNAFFRDFRPKVYYSLLGFLLFVVLLLSSKAAYLSVLCILLVKGFSYVKESSTWMKSVFFCSFLLTSFLLFFLNPKTRELVDKLFSVGFTVDPNGQYSYENRLQTWYASVRLIRENFWMGTGIGDAQHQLDYFYSANHFTVALGNQFNSHNQFLTTFLELGLFGFIFFLGWMFSIVRLAYVRSQKVLLMFMLLLIINFCVESMFERYHGISFAAFFFCLFVSYNTIDDE
jgi:O-antigen ligase